MNFLIPEDWSEKLNDVLNLPYFKQLEKDIVQKYKSETQTYPEFKNIFKAFELCPFNKVKVVILGQDPYHGVGQAEGLSFSVPEGKKIPPSLRNIYKELESDLGITTPPSGSLQNWARQGVLLINATLTVEDSSPASHQGLGWETFTDAVIKKVSEDREHVVFLLWGKFAESKAELIDQKKHLVLTSSHPSPFSAHRGFIGCKHFSKTNTYLSKHNQKPIQW